MYIHKFEKDATLDLYTCPVHPVLRGFSLYALLKPNKNNKKKTILFVYNYYYYYCYTIITL